MKIFLYIIIIIKVKIIIWLKNVFLILGFKGGGCILLINISAYYI